MIPRRALLLGPWLGYRAWADGDPPTCALANAPADRTSNFRRFSVVPFKEASGIRSCMHHSLSCDAPTLGVSQREKPTMMEVVPNPCHAPLP